MSNDIFGSSSRPRSATTSLVPPQVKRQLSGAALTSRANADHSGSAPPATDGTTSLMPPSSSRLRSGSLTLPANGLTNAFGPAVFSRSWTPTDQSALPSPAIPEEVRSVGSNESTDDVTTTDLAGTMDYLGLHANASSPTLASGPLSQTNETHAKPASLDSQVFSLYPPATHDSPGRVRAQTLATFSRQTPPAGESVRTHVLLNSILDERSPLSHEALSAALRPRAATIGLLQNDVAKARTRHLGDSAGANAATEETRASSVSQDGVYGASLDALWLHGGDGDEIAAFPPSRALFLKNLDPRFSAPDLSQAFAAYGVIDNIRLLSDKNQAFVNFISLASAIAARDDIVNRLGGRLTPSSDPVKIGFGRAESVPGTPAGLQTPVQSMSFTSADPQTSPTRALWIGSIPPAATPSDLLHVFGSWGPIESARVLTHKVCAFVNYERLDDAVRARKALNGREIFGSEIGAVKIGYAKVPAKSASPDVHAMAAPGPATLAALTNVRGATSAPIEEFAASNVHDYRSSLLLNVVTGNVENEAHSSSLAAADQPSVTDLQLFIRELAPNDEDLEEDVAAVAHLPPPASYYTAIPPPLSLGSGPWGNEAANVAHHRGKYADPPRLREMRKRLDGGLLSPLEIDALAYELVEDAAALSSDYQGNCVIQALFQLASPPARMALLDRIAPHLASIGIHKNGTWAAQKELASSAQEVTTICRHLMPYIPPLLLDQFGNYVVGCILRFGSPTNDFAFDAMVNRCWEIGQSRFGARAMRTLLENPQTTRLQQKRVAIAIILNAIPLATSPNGVLVLTWLLDTSNFPGRYRLLAPRLAAHLSHLCTHKLAAMTVLRVINQKNDPPAARMLIDALFESPHIVEDILGDQIHGVAFLLRVISSPYLDSTQRRGCISHVQRALDALKVDSVPAYAQLVQTVQAGGELPANFVDSSPMGRHGRGSGLHRQSPRPSSAWNSPQQGHSPLAAPHSPNAGRYGANSSPGPQHRPLGPSSPNGHRVRRATDSPQPPPMMPYFEPWMAAPSYTPVAGLPGVTSGPFMTGYEAPMPWPPPHPGMLYTPFSPPPINGSRL